uniref:Uncharacterized protein n=1 Tax=Populus trichocarpa TaxID=3694 RepID=A0A2K2CCN9_POPTR
MLTIFTNSQLTESLQLQDEQFSRWFRTYGNNFKTEKFRATKNKPKPKLFLPSQPTASLPLQKRSAAASPSFGSLWLLLKPSAPPSLGSPFPRSPLSWPLTHFRALPAVALHGANAPSLFWQIPEGFPLIL